MKKLSLIALIVSVIWTRTGHAIDQDMHKPISAPTSQIDEHIKIIPRNLLKEHEQINPHHVQELAEALSRTGYVPEPIIVDQKTLIILDGHHRFHALGRLGYTQVPVFFVDYTSDTITVTSWRDDEVVTKERVIKAGLSGNLLKTKTSRHHILNRPRNTPIPLEALR